MAADDTETRGDLALALYRLEQIERNTRQLVSWEVWDTNHRHLKGRVQALEAAAEQERRNKRQLTIGVVVALVAPSVTAIPVILQGIGQG